MASIKRLKPGQVVYEICRQKMGNTKATRGCLFEIRIVEADPEGDWVLASWNHNPVRKYSQRQANKWRVSKPEPKRKIFGMDDY